MSGEASRFRQELIADPELCARVLADPVHFPPFPKEPGRVQIRCDSRHVDQAIARGVALALVQGEIAELQLIGDSNADRRL